MAAATALPPLRGRCASTVALRLLVTAAALLGLRHASVARAWLCGRPRQARLTRAAASGAGSSRVAGRSKLSLAVSSSTWVSHTSINVPPPWDENFEASWAAPTAAIGGSLLRLTAGHYVAAVDWASLSDCQAWLHAAAARTDPAAQASTQIYERCVSDFDPSRKSVSGGAPAKGVATAAAAAPPPAAVAASVTAVSAALIPGLGNLQSSAGAPEIPTPAFGTMGSSGEDPEMSEEDELMSTGGDPSFLDDAMWGDAPSTSLSAAAGEATGAAKGWEWDGVVDDNAHLVDEDSDDD